jgi:hypothetical protein
MSIITPRTITNPVYGSPDSSAVMRNELQTLQDQDELLDAALTIANPITTRGDVIIGNASGVASRLGIGAANQVLISDGTDVSWGSVAGTGDVVGPSSSTDNAIARFDGTTGKLLQNSGIYITDRDSTGSDYIDIKTPDVAGQGTILRLFGGNSSDGGAPGRISITGGYGIAGNNAGADAYTEGGNGYGSGAGGIGYVKGGVGGATGAGGATIVQGGAGGATSGAGGNGYFYGGNASAGDSDGGSLILMPGSPTGSGDYGSIFLYQTRASTYGAILDLSLIASSNKIFTFPNQSGTFALFQANSNFGVGTQTFGTNAVSTLAINNGTPPADHVDEEIQIFSQDSSDGTATLGLMLEQQVESIGTFTASHKIKVNINGTFYWLQLDAV